MTRGLGNPECEPILRGMAAVAELFAPFQQAFSRGQRRGGLTLSPEALQVVRDHLPEFREESEELIQQSKRLAEDLRAQPEPALVYALADEVIESLEAVEARSAEGLRTLEAHRRRGFSGESLIYLEEIIALASRVAEAARDARWIVMAERAKARPPEDLLPAMSIGELRKLVAAR
jgi:cell division septum initiation protein DivIVA